MNGYGHSGYMKGPMPQMNMPGYPSGGGFDGPAYGWGGMNQTSNIDWGSVPSRIWDWAKDNPDVLLDAAALGVQAGLQYQNQKRQADIGERRVATEEQYLADQREERERERKRRRRAYLAVLQMRDQGGS